MFPLAEMESQKVITPILFHGDQLFEEECYMDISGW
jgi:hypothetical protein